MNVPISFLAGHGILSVKMNEDIQKLCININSPPCQHILGEAYAFMNGINLYGIYYDCAGQRPMLQVHTLSSHFGTSDPVAFRSVVPRAWLSLSGTASSKILRLTAFMSFQALLTENAPRLININPQPK